MFPGFFGILPKQLNKIENGGLIEVKRNFMRKKLRRTNQDSNSWKTVKVMQTMQEPWSSLEIIENTFFISLESNIPFLRYTIFL